MLRKKRLFHVVVYLKIPGYAFGNDERLKFKVSRAKQVQSICVLHDSSMKDWLNCDMHVFNLIKKGLKHHPVYLTYTLIV